MYHLHVKPCTLSIALAAGLVLLVLDSPNRVCLLYSARVALILLFSKSQCLFSGTLLSTLIDLLQWTLPTELLVAAAPESPSPSS